jgi:hypothetical protein
MSANVPTNVPTGASWEHLQASDLGAASRIRTGGLRITSSSYIASSSFQQRSAPRLPGEIRQLEASGIYWNCPRNCPHDPRTACASFEQQTGYDV